MTKADSAYPMAKMISGERVIAKSTVSTNAYYKLVLTKISIFLSISASL